MHHLWHCPCNVGLRAKLDEAVPGNAFPDTLLACLAKCGLVPSGFLQRSGFSREQTQSIQQYLLAANDVATCAQTNDEKQTECDANLHVPRSLPVTALYAGALPPLQKFRSRRAFDDLHQGCSTVCCWPS